MASISTDEQHVGAPDDAKTSALGSAELSSTSTTAASPDRDASIASPEGDTTQESGQGKWSVDTSYIGHRTSDPNRLEARRKSIAEANEPVVVGAPGSTKDDDGKWSVDTSYIGHRTEVVANLRASTAVSSDVSAAASESVKRDSDGSWKVNTSYINHRAGKLESTDPVLAGSHIEKGIPTAVSVASVKQDGGSWKVDTSYIDHRTAAIENLGKKQVAPAGDACATVSSMAKKEGNGSWKVDTSYIGYRTVDTANLTRKDDTDDGLGYADPSESKRSYEEMKGKGNTPDDVNPLIKELYLTDEEFEQVFEMSLKEFSEMPRWKQQNLKKAKDMF